MSDPTQASATRKPTKSLPTDRVSYERQLAVLRAYGAIAGEQGKSAVEIGQVVPIHGSSVSVCNPFFTESGLIERSGTGNKATKEVVDYHRAMEWDATTAAEKLAPALRTTWYWKALFPRLSFRPLDESEAVRILSEECDAGPAYRAQIKMILDYLISANLATRDGTQIKRGPLASGDGQGTPQQFKQNLEGNIRPTGEVSLTPQPQAPTVMPGISFDASIQISMKDMGAWTPEQIKEFFAGLAVVIAAKNRAG